MAPDDLPRPDVPAAIAVVRDFVNTTDHETGADDLTTPADLSDWLHAEGRLSPRREATQDEWALALRLRAGLRRALERNHEGLTDPDPALAAVLAELPITLTWTEAGPTLTSTATGVLGALATIGLAAHTAAVDDQWWRLKICAADDCAWAYYDHSKNRSRNWCEYGCGNKVKTRAYRARQRSAT
ncbi:CGNR zinc finger domain-containing protein [Nocardioides sp.]|uniref:CGNR zinc finger domain-containing protein n=1 Tax=Nocardioides sp. TaxID=35761 RepID=UPI003D122257